MGTGAMEGPLWGARAREWVELQEPSWRPEYASVLDAIRVREGHEVLDVGCGSGGALRLVRERGECDFAYADPATAWRALSSAGGIVRIVRQVGEPPVRDAVLGALAPFTRADGTVVVHNRFHWVAGTP